MDFFLFSSSVFLFRSEFFYAGISFSFSLFGSSIFVLFALEFLLVVFACVSFGIQDKWLAANALSLSISLHTHRTFHEMTSENCWFSWLAVTAYAWSVFFLTSVALALTATFLHQFSHILFASRNPVLQMFFTLASHISYFVNSFFFPPLPKKIHYVSNSIYHKSFTTL